jgi:hypothetical protein
MNLYHTNMTTSENKNPPSNDRKKRRSDDSIVISDVDNGSYPSFLIVEPTTIKRLSCQYSVFRSCSSALLAILKMPRIYGMEPF